MKMYELFNGSARLVGALERCAQDPERIKYLADVLSYCDDQLMQDIEALADFYELQREK